MKNTVLIVDDNSINRKILKRILITEYEVLEAKDGKEALDIFSANHTKIQAIMLDLVMPVMDGYEFLKEFSKFEESAHIPVIVSTGQADSDSEIVALSLGAWDFIAKPYVPEIIHFRLNNAIVRSQLTAFQELQYKAEYDVLTDIYNKDKYFSATHNMLIEHSDEKFTLIRFDIDRFHLINSYSGSEYGDRLLRHMASMVKEKRYDFPYMTFGRITADIFSVCIPTDDEKVIKGVISTWDKSIKKYDATLDIVSTFGICVIENNNDPADEIYDHATLAAKSCKGNYTQNYAFYVDEMEKSIELEQEIINDMNTAIEEEQFEIWYQPKMDIRINAPAGAEALVRWRHPEKGMISPGAFIPVFEHNGFISTLDYYVWEHVCMDLRAWMDEGTMPYPVSVNVSRVDVANRNLVSLIVDLVDKYNIPHELFNLELTESAYIDSPDAMIRMMKDFQSHGFIILMDDFGSGYSSLSVLKDIDIDQLKIDMNFFSKTAVESRGKSIIASVIRMAKWLEIPVISEGVEDKEQVDFLHGLGCEYIQGYYFGKPMPLKDYKKYIAEHSAAANNSKHKIFDAKKVWDSDFVLANIQQPAAMIRNNNGKLEIIHVNIRFYDMFGFDKHQERFMDMTGCVDQKYRNRLIEAFDKSIESHDIVDVEYKRNVKYDSKMWIHAKVKYIGNIEDSNLFYCIFADVSDSKLIDEEFKKYLESANAMFETGTLLIVDDVEINREVLRTIFQDDYKILVASNGQEALDVLKENNGKVDAILLDIIMPVMDGPTFMTKIKDEPNYNKIPIIVITSDANASQQEKTIALGASDYIVKPFVEKVVVRRVKNVLGLHSKLVSSFKKMKNETQTTE